GLKLGPDDNYYIAQNGSGRVLVVSEDKKLVRTIEVPTPYVTNLAFGESGTGTIFVTGVFDEWKPPYPGTLYRWQPLTLLCACGWRMLRNPVARNFLAAADPDIGVTLDVLEQPRQCADAARASDDAAMQADGHHSRPPFASRSIQPIEGIAAIAEEIFAGG